MKFYNVKLKKFIEISDEEIEIIRFNNGRPAAKTEILINGTAQKLYKILSKTDAKKYKQLK